MKRRGFTLIELMSVLAALTILLGMSVSLLGSLVRGQRAMRAELDNNASAARLARAFRQDVHAATRFISEEPADLPADARAWRLRFDEDRAVEYRFAPGEMVRMVRRGDEKTLERETFPLQAGAGVTIEIGPAGQTGQARLVTLVVAPATGRGGAPRRVDAVLAKDHRFEKTSSEEKQP